MFDFVVTELQAREHGDEQRIRAVRVVLDGKWSAIAQVHDTPEPLVREALVLLRLPCTSQAYWQGRAGLGSASRCVGEEVPSGL